MFPRTAPPGALLSGALAGALAGAVVHPGRILIWMGAFGLIFFLVGLVLLREARPFPGGVSALGRVVELDARRDSDGDMMYTEIVEFATPAGPVRKRSALSTNYRTPIGKERQVSYRAGAPEEARVLRPAATALALLLLLAGIGVSGVNVPDGDDLAVAVFTSGWLILRAFRGGEPPAAAEALAPGLAPTWVDGAPVSMYPAAPMAPAGAALAPRRFSVPLPQLLTFSLALLISFGLTLWVSAPLPWA